MSKPDFSLDWKRLDEEGPKHLNENFALIDKYGNYYIAIFAVAPAIEGGDYTFGIMDDDDLDLLEGEDVEWWAYAGRFPNQAWRNTDHK